MASSIVKEEATSFLATLNLNGELNLNGDLLAQAVEGAHIDPSYISSDILKDTEQIGSNPTFSGYMTIENEFNEHQLPNEQSNPEFVMLPTQPMLQQHRIEVTEQPESDTYKFRFEAEKQHAAAIQGRKVTNVTDTSSEIVTTVPPVQPHMQIQVTNAPSCPAVVWIQCVESDSDPDVGEIIPSPNFLFVKKERGKEQTSLKGIQITDTGDKDGVVKLHVDNLLQYGGKISFKGPLQLALFRTKAQKVWNYLETRNTTNRNTPDQQLRLTQIQIPPLQTEKDKKQARKKLVEDIDTTRVKLCFQVITLMNS